MEGKRKRKGNDNWWPKEDNAEEVVVALPLGQEMSESCERKRS